MVIDLSELSITKVINYFGTIKGNHNAIVNINYFHDSNDFISTYIFNNKIYCGFTDSFKNCEGHITIYYLK